MQRNSQNANTPPRRIVDFRVKNQHQIFYLAVWDDNARIQEWIQDTNLVGCEKLIQEFFTSIQAEEDADLQQEGNTKRNKTANAPKPFFSKWGFDNAKISKLIKKKYEKRKSKRKGGKKSSKKYVDEDARRITQKIQQLDSFIENQPKNKLDYLLNFVTNVFKKDSVPYCTVRTLTPQRNLVVSIQHMERYFPQTLKDYYVTLLRLHNRKMSKYGAEDSSSDEEESDGRSNEFNREDSQMRSNEIQNQYSEDMIIE